MTDSKVDGLCRAPQIDQFSWYITEVLQIFCNLFGYRDYGGQFAVVYVSLQSLFDRFTFVFLYLFTCTCESVKSAQPRKACRKYQNLFT